jgi:hypothetical protein
MLPARLVHVQAPAASCDKSLRTTDERNSNEQRLQLARPTDRPSFGGTGGLRTTAAPWLNGGPASNLECVTMAQRA